MSYSLEQVMNAREEVRDAANQHAVAVDAFLDDAHEADLQRLVEAKRAAAAGRLSQDEYAEAVESYLADPRQDAVAAAQRRLQEAREGYAAAVEAFLQS